MALLGDTRPTRTLIMAAGGGELLARRFRLAIAGGPDRGRSHASEGSRVVVGSHRSADLVVKDETVSRFHCELVVAEQGIVLRDLGSRNGTLVDGVRVSEAILTRSAKIEIGKTVLRFALERTQVAIPLSHRSEFGALVGVAAATRAFFAVLERAAASDATVLLEGETGTGKEVATEAIHRESARAAGPLVVVDCASLPANLLETELFGHERGAFTGAVVARAGAFEVAEGGTLFLDEIGEMPLDLQPKLLRALESRTIARIGSSRPVRCDFRVVAATNRNLREAVNARRFRADLYYRLAVLTIRVPALRERREDIPLLVDAFLDELGASEAARREMHEAVLPRLIDQPWPGNVRELRNHVERSLALVGQAAGEPPAPRFEPPPIDPTRPLREGRDRHIAWFERRYLEELMRQHGGVVAAAARTAGVARVYLHRLLTRTGVRER